MKRVLLSLFCCCCLQQGAKAATYRWEFSLPDLGMLTSVSSSGGIVSIVTGNSAVNTVLGNHTITEFIQVYPGSDNPYLRTLWTLPLPIIYWQRN